MKTPSIPGVEPYEVRRLMALALDVPVSQLGLIDTIHPKVRARFDALVDRLLIGEPLQYIEGTVEFGPLELNIDRRALIPRPETENMWDLIVRDISTSDVPDPKVIVDLCTGSGNLALALKWAYPESRVIGTDLSADAIDLARENGELTGLGVEFHRGDLFDPLDRSLLGSVDLLVANPPYVGEFEEVPAVVRDYEPPGALFAGPDGLGVIERITSEMGEWLSSGARVFIEIGETHGKAVADMMGPGQVRIEKDQSGRPRYAIGYYVSR
ncbi:MAG: peptide chain release factor N(5)-glutamine methyltransferase [Acidimicrobiia bacterium]|nr:peptide chain release factor N(5)-glutamine methyltransferase [Acidimicrobiia bacterium]MBT8250865.1 peptide chain release factor N(5)-glutamine methyltransferase [Acidimicrobiia bacterium]NNL29028.1 peptide chain release factor N(5)-glutamine methyltransferase [Acidimicrobiia bacterium]